MLYCGIANSAVVKNFPKKVLFYYGYCQSMCITTMYAMIYIYNILSTFYNIIKVILCLFIA